jgi:beta-glucanase (GH16 family)
MVVAHDYAALWTPQGVTFYIDGQPKKHTEQSPQYPMQLMLTIYDFGGDPHRSSPIPSSLIDSGSTSFDVER